MSRFLIPLAALVAVFYPLSSIQQPTPASSSTTTIVASQAEQSDVAKKTKYDAETLVEEYWGTTDQIGLGQAPLDVQFLIATVPDPLDSSLGYLFDRHLGSLERAAETAGYVLDRFELPWPVQGQKQDQPAENEHGELQVYKRKPGVILFRHTIAKRNLLVVFLVGEIPTAGIHKTAFIDALEQTTRFCSKHSRTEDDCAEFKLMAPTFSGSVDSLVAATRGWSSRPLNAKFNIVSGSATTVEIERLSAGLAKHNIKSSFESTVRRDEDTLCEVYRFLGEMRIPLERVAILTEGSTLYGKNLRWQDGEVLRMTYPLHISQLRTATEKSRRESVEAALKTPRTGPRNIPLSLDEGKSATDVITNFSPFETFSTELVLSSLLSTISRENKLYVGIFPTDVRDLIFLAHEIRKRTPDVVLFTFGADLLYLHSDVNLDLEGMLLFSTYPLFSLNQVWTRPAGGPPTSEEWLSGEGWRWQFPSDTSQGVYNATLMLIYEGQGALESGSPFFQPVRTCAQDSSVFSQARSLPLWLSVVGKNDLWPIRLLNSKGGAQHSSITLNSPLFYSRSLVFASLPVALVIAYLAFAMFCVYLPQNLPFISRRRRRSFNRAAAGFRKNRFLEVCTEPVFPQFAPQRRPYLFSFALALATLGLIGVSVFARFLRLSPGHWQRWAGWGALLAVFAVAIVLAFSAMLFIGCKIVCAERFKKSFSLLPMFSPLLIFVLAVMQGVSLYKEDLSTQLFYHLRTVNIDSGLSPLIPFVFVAGAAILWQLCSLRRLRMLEDLRGKDEPHLAYFGEESRQTLKALEDDIIDALACDSTKLPASGFTVVLVGLPCFYLFIWSLVPSLESRPFYYFFGWSFLCVYLALSLAFLRFLTVWTRWRRMLRHLASDPICDVYADLATSNRQMPRMDLSSPFAPYAALKFSWNLGASCTAPNSGETDDIHKALEAAGNADAKGNWRLGIKQRHNALRKLAELASTTYDRIRRGAPTPSVQNGRYFWAAQSVVLFHHVFSHLQNLSLFVVTGLLLMLLAITYYPFQPREWLLSFNWFIFTATICLSLMAFVQMSRNKVLSLLSGTTPGHVTWNRDFVLRVVIYGLVPFLAIVGAQFPEGVRGIISWVTAFQKG